MTDVLKRERPFGGAFFASVPSPFAYCVRTYARTQCLPHIQRL